MEYINDWEKRKQRLLAFWDREIIDRCCCAITAPGRNMSLEDFYMCGDGRLAGTLPTEEERELEWTDGERVLKRKLHYFENAYFGGDAFPQIFLNLGAGGHGGYYKGVRPQFESSVWFFPAYAGDDPENEFTLTLDKNALTYRKMFELARYFAAESHGRYFIGMPDSTGNMDALAHVRGSENFLIDLVVNREWVEQSLIQIQQDWQNNVEEIYNIVYETNEGGACCGWLNTYAEGRHMAMQCDVSVMISKNDFDKFAMPELQAQCNWMHRSLYHHDGMEQQRHIDSLLSIDNLHAIQWTCVDGQPPPTDFIPNLRKIQAAGKSLIIPTKAEYFKPLLEQLSSKGLLLITSVDSEDDARELERLATKLTHE